MRAVHTSTGTGGITPVGDFKVYAKVALLVVGAVPGVDAVRGVLPGRDRDASVAGRAVLSGVARVRATARGRGRARLPVRRRRYAGRRSLTVATVTGHVARRSLVVLAALALVGRRCRLRGGRCERSGQSSPSTRRPGFSGATSTRATSSTSIPGPGRPRLRVRNADVRRPHRHRLGHPELPGDGHRRSGVRGARRSRDLGAGRRVRSEPRADGRRVRQPRRRSSTARAASRSTATCARGSR